MSSKDKAPSKKRSKSSRKKTNHDDDAALQARQQHPLLLRAVLSEFGFEGCSAAYQEANTCWETAGEELKASALDYLQQVIQLLPEEETAAYLEAADRCPALVARETEPLLFLRCEDLNTIKAAQRLAAYWALRVHIFGHERAHRPAMDLSGDGLLGPREIQMLQKQRHEGAGGGAGSSAALLLLPKDSRDRNVLYLDGTRSTSTKANADDEEDELARLTRLRCDFFFLTSLMQNRQTNARIVLVRHARRPPPPPSSREARSKNSSANESNDGRMTRSCCTGSGSSSGNETSEPPNAKMVVQMIQKCFPFQLGALHLVYLEEPKRASSSDRRQRLFSPGSTIVSDAPVETVVHVADSHSQMLSMLEPYGLACEGLPRNLGGIWSPQAFTPRKDSGRQPTAMQPLKGDANDGSNGQETKNMMLEALGAAVGNAVDQEMEDWAVTNYAEELTEKQNHPGSGEAAARERDGKTEEGSMVPTAADDTPPGCRDTVQKVMQDVDKNAESTGADATTKRNHEVVDGKVLDSRSVDPLQAALGGDDWVTQRQARFQLEMELHNLPEEEKSAYLKAANEAPHLVNELDPELFLRVEDFDAQRAAGRFARYWQLRRELFGDRRAYLPLDHSGYGALDEQDIEILNCGFFSVLPKTSCGKSVVFHDRLRLTSTHMVNTQAKLRVAFYICTMTLSNETSQREGIYVVRRFAPTAHKMRDHNFVSGAFGFFKTLPFRLFRFLICAPIEDRPTTWIEKLIPVESRLHQMIYSLPSDALVGKSRRDLLIVLEGLGFRVSGIPEVFGGCWSQDDFAKWLLERSAGKLTTGQTSATAAGESTSAVRDLTLETAGRPAAEDTRAITGGSGSTSGQSQERVGDVDKSVASLPRASDKAAQQSRKQRGKRKGKQNANAGQNKRNAKRSKVDDENLSRRSKRSEQDSPRTDGAQQKVVQDASIVQDPQTVAGDYQYELALLQQAQLLRQSAQGGNSQTALQAHSVADPNQFLPQTGAHLRQHGGWSTAAPRAAPQATLPSERTLLNQILGVTPPGHNIHPFSGRSAADPNLAQVQQLVQQGSQLQPLLSQLYNAAGQVYPAPRANHSFHQGSLQAPPVAGMYQPPVPAVGFNSAASQNLAPNEDTRRQGEGRRMQDPHRRFEDR